MVEKKIPLPARILLAEPQASSLTALPTTPPLSLFSRQACDVTSKGDTAWRPSLLAVLARDCQTPAATLGGTAARPAQGTSPPRWGLSSAARGGGRGEGRVQSGSAAPHLPLSLNAGVPQPEGGDAKGDTQTSGRPGQGHSCCPFTS